MNGMMRDKASIACIRTLPRIGHDLLVVFNGLQNSGMLSFLCLSWRGGGLICLEMGPIVVALFFFILVKNFKCVHTSLVGGEGEGVTIDIERGNILCFLSVL